MKAFKQQKNEKHENRKISSKDFFLFTLLYSFACVSWYVIYVQEFLDFWFAIAASNWILGTLSMQYYGFPIKNEDMSIKSVGYGIGFGILLYILSYLAIEIIDYIQISTASLELSSLLDFSLEKEKLARLRNSAPIWLISLVLLLITSPYEELFWRGYLQNIFSTKFSQSVGIFLSTLLYAAMQIPTGSLFLVLIALSAGLYFSTIYHYTKNLLICIISHALWAYCAFILIPLI